MKGLFKAVLRCACLQKAPHFGRALFQIFMERNLVSLHRILARRPLSMLVRRVFTPGNKRQGQETSRKARRLEIVISAVKLPFGSKYLAESEYGWNQPHRRCVNTRDTRKH